MHEVLGRRQWDSVEHLRRTCEKYQEMCEVKPEDLVDRAYVDLLEEAGPISTGPSGDRPAGG